MDKKIQIINFLHLFFTSSSFNAIEVNKNVSPPQILNDNTCKTYTFITLVYESLSVATRLISFLLSWVTCDNCRESMYTLLKGQQIDTCRFATIYSYILETPF